MSNSPVVLQVLPSLITGGVERGTVEMTQAIAGPAGGRWSQARAAGSSPRSSVPAGSHIALPLVHQRPAQHLAQCRDGWRA